MTKAFVRLSGYLLYLSLSLLPILTKAYSTTSCGSTINTFPYQQGFESAGLADWTASNSIWSAHTGATSSVNTGPSSAFEGSYYAYMEASSPNYPNKTSILTGPCFDLSGADYASFQFRYHMWGGTTGVPGNLKLEVSTNAGSTWTSIWSKSGDQDNVWRQAVIDLTAYVGQTIQLRFYGQTGASWQGDMAIDDLSFTTTSGSTPLACNATITSFPYQESFESGVGDWTSDNSIWTRHSGSTSSANTGPPYAADGSWYFYTEASGANYPNKTTILTSPCFDLSNESLASLTFKYHLYGSGMGSLSLQISTDQGISWVTLWSESGNVGNLWKSAGLDLSSYTGQIIRLRFYGVTGTSYTSDMAIDDVVLYNIPAGGNNTGCAGTVSNFPYQESFESGMGLWEETTEALDIWRNNSGGTTSSGTGPSSAFDGIYYMYTEASTPNYPNKTGLLEGPCFNLSQAAAADLQFHYHMYGAETGSLELQVSTNNGSGWTTLWSESGDQGNSWYAATVNLNDYIGQTIKLRFRAVTGSLYRSDMAIDALVLSAPTSVSGTLAGTVAFPFTDTCSDTDFQLCCDPNPSGGAVANVPLTIEDVISTTTYPTTTDANGDFTENIPGTTVKISTTIPDNVWNNGVTVSDVIALNQHISGTKIIDCPMRRVAADINHDGALNQTDLDLMQDLTLGNITSVSGAPNWKFIPKKYADDADTHIDRRFVGDFWNNEVADVNGVDYPFQGAIRDQSVLFTYNGTATWEGIINPSTFEPGAECPSNEWGFYMVKAGDINGSASYYFPPGGGSGNLQTVVDYLQASPIRNTRLPGKRSGNNKYEVNIVASASEKVLAYQMAVHFDDEVIEIDKIKPNTEYLNQVTSKNFGQALKTVRGGSFKTLWRADLEQDPEGKDMAVGITLFSFELKSDEALEAIAGAIQLDDAILETAFYGANGLINGVDLQIFIEPSKDK